MTTMDKTSILIGVACIIGHSALPSSTPELVGIAPSNSFVQLEWTNGFAPFQVQARTSLVAGAWANLGSPTFSRSATDNAGSEDTVLFRVLGSTAAADSAQYKLTFDSTWSASTHPTNFPSPNEHYSPLIGGTHNAGVSFWAPGGQATPGIKTMAETGNPNPLAAEVNSAITAGTAEFVLSGGAMGTSPASINMSFTITQSHPLATVVTMIAPSPDWFVGVHGAKLFVDGDWIDEATFPLLPYDAGTDDGTTYTSGNAPSSPPQPIFLITGYPLEHNGSVAPFGTFTFTRIN
ncbi:hypothetical protein PDESU_05308 [Pontiella desulfatans]|uniref:Spondin domain-containing protein n=1 Tax=Pontiella desulfatans TaxID=2750659 RepID=A0A6C2UAJ4_PONDE|nr:spondin domain-containing protein [Pontiella desulfatans]VGO16717.1 hypothetical protein PDESU_05308 [Pontiella desulfatans]